MQHPVEIGQAIRDKQVRYHHEAYLGRLGSHPVRCWMGTHLIQLGEAVRGHVSERVEATIIEHSQRRAA